jgi:hypothetical protein
MDSTSWKRMQYQCVATNAAGYIPAEIHNWAATVAFNWLKSPAKSSLAAGGLEPGRDGWAGRGKYLSVMCLTYLTLSPSSLELTRQRGLASIPFYG